METVLINQSIYCFAESPFHDVVTKIVFLIIESCYNYRVNKHNESVICLSR